MEALSSIGSIVNLILTIVAILAVVEVFHISATLRKILAAIKAADEHRREEFDSMAPES